MKDFYYDKNNTFLFKVFVMMNSTQAFVSTDFPIFLLLLFWQLKFPNGKSFLKLFWSNIVGRVRHENARGWINSREEDRENIPPDGQEPWWEIVFRRIYWGKMIQILKIKFLYWKSGPGCKEWSIHREAAPVWSCQLETPSKSNNIVFQ